MNGAEEASKGLEAMWFWGGELGSVDGIDLGKEPEQAPMDSMLKQSQASTDFYSRGILMSLLAKWICGASRASNDRELKTRIH